MQGRFSRVAGRRALRLSVVTVVLLAVAAGIAYATIPSGSGVFTACKLNGVGTIRLIDPSLPHSSFLSHCTPFETEVSWNAAGGAAGPAGPGRTRRAGRTEGRHRSGRRGRRTRGEGRSRRSRAQGPKGDTGNTGATGPTGPMGPSGLGVGQKLIAGGTYGVPDSTGSVAMYTSTGGFTVTTTDGSGIYDIKMPPGTWSVLPDRQLPDVLRRVDAGDHVRRR